MKDRQAERTSKTIADALTNLHRSHSHKDYPQLAVHVHLQEVWTEDDPRCLEQPTEILPDVFSQKEAAQ